MNAPALVVSLTTEAQRLASLTRPDPDDILEHLIDAGGLESGIAHARAEPEDDDHPDANTWRTVTLALARAFVAATGREQRHAPAHLAHAALVAGFAGELPDQVLVTPVDGFARRAVYPQMFVAAARLAVQARRPSHAVVIGPRSGSGTVLSAVAAAALEQQRVDCATVTVTLRGPAESPYVRVGDALRRRVLEHPRALLLLVADGPGKTGASFGTLASWLRSEGVGDARIVLLSTRVPDPAELQSEEGRRCFERHAAFAVPFETAVLARGLHGHMPDRLQDLSAGAWRRLPAFADLDLPADPRHERRKYLTLAAVPERVLLKFAGLGRHGRARLARAERLAAAGFMPGPDALANGFLALPWVEGTPLAASDANEALLRSVADYLAWLRQNARTGGAADPASLAEMLRDNVHEALGEFAAAAVARACAEAARFPPEPAVDIDGRVFPHEWVEAGRRVVKTDALEHHDDPLFPGPHDIAWDVAGVISEWGLDAGAETFFLRRYAEATRDSIGERLPYYQLAYEAFRFGSDTLAARDLAGTEDGARFEARSRHRQRKLARYAAAW